MKNRVLLVVRWPVGGIRTFIRYVYRNFDPSKWHFTIIAPDLEETKILLDDLSEHDVSYAPVLGMPDNGSSGFAKMFSCVLSQLVRKNYDLIHSHGFTSGISAALAALVSRTPHVMTSHDVINENQFSGWKGKVKKRVVERLFGMIDSIHSVSYDAQMNLLSHFPGIGNRAGKCIVIPNGIEVDRFIIAESRDLRGELRLGQDVFLVGFMGRFMAQKGFRYLVDAVEILREEYDLPKRLLILTFGEGAFIREEKDIIGKKGLNDFFCFMQFTPNVAGTIKGIDLVVMPSLWEACGLVAMETLTCGTPLIGTDCLGLREVLKSTPARIVPVGDSASIASAIREEMLYPSKTEATAFQKVAAARFAVEKQAAEIEKLMTEHLKKR
jgi:glycosyltransferase involved in cell wall biosynthesis